MGHFRLPLTGVGDRGSGRFIPACAGNGSFHRSRRAAHSVHPRVCGERGSRRWSCWAAPGSSPRVRGTAVHEERGRRLHRFIPACAGNGHPRSWRHPRSSVHPRVCGERDVGSFLFLWVVRFIPACAGNGHAWHGRARRQPVHPACAGNGSYSSGIVGCSPVHPRVCGERGGRSQLGRRGTGSSPRVRGTDVQRRAMPRLNRFIPACAGNGGSLGARARTATVHPRVCGDGLAPGSALGGSPVHPRVCGERSVSKLWANPYFGSSPRVRGTADAGPTVLQSEHSVPSPRVRGTGKPRVEVQERQLRRFIPACAGNGSTVSRSGTTATDGSSPRVRGTGRN